MGVLMKVTPNVPLWSQVLDEMQAAGYTETELGPRVIYPLIQSGCVKNWQSASAHTHLPVRCRHTINRYHLSGQAGHRWLGGGVRKHALTQSRCAAI